jgi:hypothetical protein
VMRGITCKRSVPVSPGALVGITHATPELTKCQVPLKYNFLVTFPCARAC